MFRLKRALSEPPPSASSGLVVLGLVVLFAVGTHGLGVLALLWRSDTAYCFGRRHSRALSFLKCAYVYTKSLSASSSLVSRA